MLQIDPERLKFQQPYIDEAAELFKTKDVVFLEGPTGSGKTVVAEKVRQKLGSRGVYVCTDKTLQKQVARDFTYAKLLQGRANYPTISGPSYITAADCNKEENVCFWCPDVYQCPYEIAKQAALHADLAILNTSYLLTEGNYVGRFRNLPFVVADECDKMEDILTGFVQFAVTSKWLDKLNMEVPQKGSHKTTIARWLGEFVEELSLWQKDNKGGQGVQIVKDRNTAEDLIVQAERVKKELEDNGDNWIRDNDAGPLVLRPVEVSRYGADKLWKLGNKWLLMSATIISPELEAENLGIEEAGLEWGSVRMPATFPIENRLMHVAPVADMGYRNKAESWPIMREAVARIVDIHDERVLIHATSYEFTRYLRDYLAEKVNGRPVIIYESAKDRDVAVKTYREAKSAVLIAPSLDRGIDLKDDQCRVQIIPKMPNPNLSDPRVSQRLHSGSGNMWYALQTMRSLVQMTGRGVRSKDDYCTTYILDKQFMGLKKKRGLVPEWWAEALDTSYDMRWLTR